MTTDKWMLIRGARQLLTLHHQSAARSGRDLSELGLISDGSVLLRNGVVEAVGPTRRIENMARARYADEVNATGRVVMPGFIDPHACVAPVPGYRRDSGRTVQSIPATRLEAQADELLRLMARHGTAVIGALSGYGTDAAGELKILRALHARAQKPLDLVSILSFRSIQKGETQEDVRELLTVAARRKLAGAVAIRCGEDAVPRASAETLLDAAHALMLSTRLELTPHHDLEFLEAALTKGLHSVVAPSGFRPHEIEYLADASVFSILLPVNLARNGSSGSARDLIDGGAQVALGSGLNPDSGGAASMQTVIQIAVEQLGLTPAEAISASTVNAALALGVGAHHGSLEHGKSGDLLLLDASDYREIPLLAGTNLVHAMIKRGILLFEEDFPGWLSQD
jgi:imidazolonepropionase